MPRKTKKQKIKSFLKQKLINQTPLLKQKDQNDQIQTRNFVISDLKKTLILTFFAILIEVVLYFKWR